MALQAAYMKGNVGHRRALLASGLDVNYANAQGSTALLVASRLCHAECMYFLLEAGANVNHNDDTGTEALMRVISYGHAECASLLLEAGADVNHAD
mmetsp:Transcript_7974/g.19369  ORF Transcript_7974/g.19369 Transcript_7974/m.19369 type:complete len:96 (-) Transcript_7974:285-572(-)